MSSYFSNQLSKVRPDSASTVSSVIELAAASVEDGSPSVVAFTGILRMTQLLPAAKAFSTSWALEIHRRSLSFFKHLIIRCLRDLCAPS
ncbi:hypothetical protein CSKR_111187 [Clonorchis sinensis]|uniref:Uncharacterized protein n=1 Tax=Clonorchis sinensis TaxID=79923 RepID=A0A3R7CQA7_CLOSI|nr:hypothetical protein CSKR_111187 [Clonorchis sinensis]